VASKETAKFALPSNGQIKPLLSYIYNWSQINGCLTNGLFEENEQKAD
jgi:hypothetical protein